MALTAMSCVVVFEQGRSDQGIPRLGESGEHLPYPAANDSPSCIAIPASSRSTVTPAQYPRHGLQVIPLCEREGGPRTTLWTRSGGRGENAGTTEA